MAAPSEESTSAVAQTSVITCRSGRSLSSPRMISDREWVHPKREGDALLRSGRYVAKHLPAGRYSDLFLDRQGLDLIDVIDEELLRYGRHEIMTAKDAEDVVVAPRAKGQRQVDGSRPVRACRSLSQEDRAGSDAVDAIALERVDPEKHLPPELARVHPPETVDPRRRITCRVVRSVMQKQRVTSCVRNPPSEGHVPRVACMDPVDEEDPVAALAEMERHGRRQSAAQRITGLGRVAEARPNGGRDHEGWVRDDQVERAPPDGLQPASVLEGEVVESVQNGVVARVRKRAPVDVDSDHAFAVAGGEQGVKAGSRPQIEAASTALRGVRPAAKRPAGAAAGTASRSCARASPAISRSSCGTTATRGATASSTKCDDTGRLQPRHGRASKRDVGSCSVDRLAVQEQPDEGCHVSVAADLEPAQRLRSPAEHDAVGTSSSSRSDDSS